MDKSTFFKLISLKAENSNAMKDLLLSFLLQQNIEKFPTEKVDFLSRHLLYLKKKKKKCF